MTHPSLDFPTSSESLPCQQCGAYEATDLITSECPACAALTEIELCPICNSEWLTWEPQCWHCGRVYLVVNRRHPQNTLQQPAWTDGPATDSNQNPLQFVLLILASPFLLLRWIFRHITVGIGFWF